MSDNPEYNTAVLSFQQLEDKLLLARENISYALRTELTLEERLRLTNMSNKVRTMAAQLRSVR